MHSRLICSSTDKYTCASTSAYATGSFHTNKTVGREEGVGEGGGGETGEMASAF